MNIFEYESTNVIQPSISKTPQYYTQILPIIILIQAKERNPSDVIQLSTMACHKKHRFLVKKHAHWWFGARKQPNISN